MADHLVISQNGVAFTARSPAIMHGLAHAISPMVLWVGLTHDSRDQLIIASGGDDKFQPHAIKDQIEDVVFYWYADERCMNAVRDYCVDIRAPEKSKLIRLSEA
jgi:hypothetical protein